MGSADDRLAFERAIVEDLDRQHHGGRAAHHVLHGREGEAFAAQLALRGRGVRLRFEVGAGVHHHAELREQQRQRQHMDEPAAIASYQRASAGEYSRCSGYGQAQLVESYSAVTRQGAG